MHKIKITLQTGRAVSAWMWASSVQLIDQERQWNKDDRQELWSGVGGWEKK